MDTPTWRGLNRHQPVIRVSDLYTNVGTHTHNPKLDSDKDGVIDMDEWLYNLDTYKPLKDLIEKVSARKSSVERI